MREACALVAGTAGWILMHQTLGATERRGQQMTPRCIRHVEVIAIKDLQEGRSSEEQRQPTEAVL